MNLWDKLYGAKRRRIDRALLASLERDIANGERLAVDAIKKAEVEASAEAERIRIAKAFGRPI